MDSLHIRHQLDAVWCATEYSQLANSLVVLGVHYGSFISGWSVLRGLLYFDQSSRSTGFWVTGAYSFLLGSGFSNRCSSSNASTRLFCHTRNVWHLNIERFYPFRRGHKRRLAQYSSTLRHGRGIPYSSTFHHKSRGATGEEKGDIIYVLGDASWNYVSWFVHFGRLSYLP